MIPTMRRTLCAASGARVDADVEPHNYSYLEKLPVIIHGNAGTEKRGSRRCANRPYRPQITAIIGGQGALATDYSESTGPRYQNHPLAGAVARRQPIALKTRKRVQQWVAGYDPQAAVMRWLPLATIAILTARGSSPEP